MLMLLLFVPLCLLCFYLAFLCYRKAYYRHALALAGIAFFFLLAALGIVGVGLFGLERLQAEAAGQ